MRITSFLASILITVNCNAQVDSAKSLSLSAYIETYYSYDFSKPKNFEKLDYTYNYKKHNQFNVNLAFLKASYQAKRIRSNLALMTGNYAKYNLSAEPNWAKLLLEANAGFKPFKQHNFWIDAGVLPSHIGFESAVGSDCWNLTRSLLAENSPYYESGVKLNYTNEKENLFLAFLVLNGWQRIEVSDWGQTPSFGIQVNYKPRNSLTLNYSNFIGRIKLESINALRVFHNLFAIYEASPKISFIIGFDIGTQQDNDKKLNVWYTPVLISKVNLTQKSKIAGRLEYYKDKKQVLIQTGTLNGYQTFGASVNYDYQITPKLLCRAELKKYASKDHIFKSQSSSNKHTSATISLVVKFEN
jgi:hypothetical protein